MAVEIERKFLVNASKWQEFRDAQQLEGVMFRQGYLAEGESTVRVRLEGDKGRLTIKGKTRGLSRLEFEYPIPAEDAEQLLDALCGKPLIEKHRYVYRSPAGDTWEVDEFHGENRGLIVAEIELPSESASFERPDWLAEEVSHDDRYFNVNLAKHPFTRW
ncbi:MAG: CYTH domain-containing protein [Ketobacteraceae bacterium]|nr:CYTH domain-containing protein [Ketobacteraceae bacterium]